MKRRFLVIVHAGDHSQHPQWLATTDARTWDLVVHYHGTNPHRFPPDGDGMTRIDGAGLKWPALARLLSNTREVWQGYDAVWLPDDDLAVSGAAIDRMFAIMADLDLHLAQPAMAWSSPEGAVLALHNPRFALRYTSFVEVAAVALSTPLLSRILPTLSESASGAGLGHLWAQRLDTPASQCAILDCVQVAGTLSGAARRAAAATDQAGETARLLQRHGIAAPMRLAYGGLDPGGRRTTLFDPDGCDFLFQLCDGYRPLASVSQQLLGEMFEQHARARDDVLKVATAVTASRPPTEAATVSQPQRPRSAPTPTPTPTRAASAAAPARPPRMDPPDNEALGLPPDYRPRTVPVGVGDARATSDSSGHICLPDVYALVAGIATAINARRVVDIGCGQAGKLMALAGRFETVGVDVGANVDDCRRRYPAAQWLRIDLERVDPGDIAPLVDDTTVVVCSDVMEHLVDPRPLARALAALAGRAAAVVISTPERVLTRGAVDRGPPADPSHVREWQYDEFAEFLGRCGFRGLDFHGLTRSTTAREEWFTIVSVAARPGDLAVAAALEPLTGFASVGGQSVAVVRPLLVHPVRLPPIAPVRMQFSAAVQAIRSNLSRPTERRGSR